MSNSKQIVKVLIQPRDESLDNFMNNKPNTIYYVLLIPRNKTGLHPSKSKLYIALNGAQDKF